MLYTSIPSAVFKTRIRRMRTRIQRMRRTWRTRRIQRILFIYLFNLFYLTLVYKIAENNSTNKYQQNQDKI